jgi:hypothetical protein
MSLPCLASAGNKHDDGFSRMTAQCAYKMGKTSVVERWTLPDLPYSGLDRAAAR